MGWGRRGRGQGWRWVGGLWVVWAGVWGLGKVSSPPTAGVVSAGAAVSASLAGNELTAPACHLLALLLAALLFAAICSGVGKPGETTTSVSAIGESGTRGDMLQQRPIEVHSF